MYYPQVQENSNNRTMIDTWYGYNHNYKINAGEFYDMENLTSDNFPLMTPRKIRKKLKSGTNIRGVLMSSNDIAWLDGTTLKFGSQEVDLSEYMEDKDDWQTMLRFNAYILIFPAAVYVNVYNVEDKGTIKARYTTEADVTVTYSMCRQDGSTMDATASDEPPENPENGQYWLCSKEGESGLYMWDSTQAMWQPVAVSYIRIDVPGANFTDYFQVDDILTMNTTMADINNGSKIISLTDESIVVIGFMPAVQRTDHTTDVWRVYFERSIPILDYVCICKNRVWGCHYGYANNQMVNEIYCTKLGDFKNWYSYQGSASDSFSVTVGVPGEFTGCISYQGYPTFFKENAILRVFGVQASEFSVNEIDARGVQQGSYRSLAIVDEMLVYKSASDICAFDGSVPVSISANLGREQYYYDAVGGGCLNKYNVVMETALGGKRYFVYDFAKGIWEKEDGIAIGMFTVTENGQMYAATRDSIYGLGITENAAYVEDEVSEEWVAWYATTGEMGYEYPDYKFVDRLTVRAYVPNRSELKVSISYDERPFEYIGTLRGSDNIGTQSLVFNPFRCDHFRIKFEGHGDCRIYSLAITMDTGSEESNGY